jgi:aspartyl-tRNA synthetase
MAELERGKPDWSASRADGHCAEKRKVFSTDYPSGALDSGGVVKGMNAKGFASITTGQIEHLTELAKQYGAKGLAFIKVENGEWKSPIVKFFSEEEKQALTSQLAIEEGDRSLCLDHAPGNV